MDRQQLAAEDAQQTQPICKHKVTHEDDPIVARLKPIWQSVLQQEHLDADSNFFDYGGDSLAAAILVFADGSRVWPSDLDRYVDQVPDHAQAGRGFTARKMPPKWLRAKWKTGTSWCHCNRSVRKHQSYAWLVSTAFLELPTYGWFTRRRSAMWGLQAVGLNGTDKPLTEIVDMAADHVRTLQAVLPHGPIQPGRFLVRWHSSVRDGTDPAPSRRTSFAGLD